MRKVFTCLFLTLFCVSNGWAADSSGVTRILPSAISTATSTENARTAPVTDGATTSGSSRAAVSRAVVGTPTTTTENTRTSVSRIVPTETANTITTTTRTGDTSTVSRTAVSRGVVANEPSEVTSGRNTNTTGKTTGVSRSVNAANVRQNLESAANTVGRNARTEAASINNTAAVRRAGITLRPTTAEVGGRAIIAGTDVQTGSNVGAEARAVMARAGVTQRESITEATERLQQTAELNKSCQQQYNDCMDQFCNVLDANQKRCSCSPNLSRYAKVEAAVKDANAQLNEVAQRIRYVGLSADEIRAIMSATEAEEVLSGTRDNTESRNMLEEIEKLIRNPSSSTTYTADTSTGLDMELDFSGDAGSLFNLDFLGNNTSSFSNLRGTDLYNAAKKRCNTILTQCKGAGATQNQITGNYDLAIDKDCVAYEQGLTKMNDTLKNNVRSATQMLQKARLSVLQNKNLYDAKGCIGALNTCMIDDMVCGADYAKCVDPTKRYIDENGKVVLGQRISDITAFMTNYDNSQINEQFLRTAKSMVVNVTNCKSSQYNNGTCVANYLLTKIGTGKTISEGGLCRAVLDKCQRVTYNGSNGAYNPYNEVVINYIQRAMVNIQAAQKTIISDYASSCMVEIATCYNQQVSQVSAWSTSASTDSIYNVMRGACRNVALTCAYAVFEGNTTMCPTGTGTTNENKCIDSVSQMFYQSLLCPENSSYQSVKGTAGSSGYVNDRCKCDTGYVIFGKTCTRACSAGQYRNSLTGLCDTCPGGTYNTLNNAENTSCTQCPAGSYCPAGSTNHIVCPSGTTSLPGSADSSFCV